MAHSGTTFTQTPEAPELERRVEELCSNVTGTLFLKELCVVVCDWSLLWCVMSHRCVSIVSYIGYEGASALSRSLTHLTQLTHLDLSGECVHWCITWRMCVWCHIDMWCVVWVQASTLEIREQMHWVRAWHTWHNSHTLTWVVSVLIDVCCLTCVMCDATLMCDVWCHIDVMCGVSTDNDIGVEGARTLSQCLTYLTQLKHLNLYSECALMCYLICVMQYAIWCM